MSQETAAPHCSGDWLIAYPIATNSQVSATSDSFSSAADSSPECAWVIMQASWAYPALRSWADADAVPAVRLPLEASAALAREVVSA